MKSQNENPAKELQAAFDRWDALKEHGGNDPTWADGVGLNLVRNHIFFWKSRIEQEYPQGNIPEIYLRPAPPKIPDDYMARADEIRLGAKTSLALYLKNSDYQFLLMKIGQLNPTDAKRLCVRNVISYVTGLEDAIQKGNLVNMRHHEKSEIYLQAFSQCAQKIRDLKPRENEQMSIFCGDIGVDTGETETGRQSMEMKL
jgi:hypothetical protein